MNQAGSENKCSKRVSNECILNNYNFDDVATDQNSICENCKQRGCSVCSKHSCHVGTASNTQHVVEVAEVRQQQQTGINNLYHQSLLQKVWVYIHSVIITPMSGCPKCNSKLRPSPSDESLSTESSQSSTSSPSLSRSPSRLSCLSCLTTCQRDKSPSQTKPSCPRASAPNSNARTPCPKTVSPCPRPTPSCPNVKSPCANANRTASDTKPTCCPHTKPFCLNAKCPNPSCTNVKPSCKNLQAPCPYALPPCPNVNCPSTEPSCPSLQPPCPNAEPPPPNAKCCNAKPSCPSFQPTCPHVKPPCLNAKCPNAKPSCPSFLKLKNSKTSLYHSFSNESLSSICKESLVELTKVYIQKITSDHKIMCPRCSKTTCANSKDTLTSYLRSLFDQAWSYLNMTEQNNCQPQCVSECSNTSTDPRISESPSPTKLRCCCVGSQATPEKIQSCDLICGPKPVCCIKSINVPEPATCPTCLPLATCTKPLTRPRPVNCPICLKPTCVKVATCPKFYKCEGTTLPAQRSKEEGTHEHKSCDTPCCVHKSQGIQPSYIMADKSCWSSQTPVNPLFKRSCQIKTPQSVEELKASITGLNCLDKSSGNMLGREIVDYRSSIKYSKPCVQDLKVSRDSICSTDIPPPKLDCSLAMEQNDHTFGTEPKECRHSKESLDKCEETMTSFNDLKEQTCKEDAICPSSGGHAKSDEVLLDKDFSSNPRDQVHNKEIICQSSRNSMTSVDSNHPDPKDCNATEVDALRKDPYNYRYYY